MSNIKNNESIYCVKCRNHVDVIEYKIVTLKSERDAYKGKCPHCQTFVYKIVSKKS